MKAGEKTIRGWSLRGTVLLCTLSFTLCAFAGGPSGKKNDGSTNVVSASDADMIRIAGEQRFRANCGRCHAAPQKFPPRMMKTVLRHMRVRATITDEDMRLVLLYMSQ